MNGGVFNLGASSAPGILNTAITLTLNGGTFNYNNSGNTTQSTGTLALGAGSASVTAAAGDTLKLGAFSRTAGGAVNFGSTGIITTTTANTSGILSVGATYGGTQYAVSGLTATAPITGFSAYNNNFSNAGGANVTADTTAANNDSLNGNTTLTNTVTINSLTITDTTSGDTLALGNVNLNTTGLLYGGGSTFNITGNGGVLSNASGASELVIMVSSGGNLVISAPIDSITGGAGALTLGGSGTVTLNNPSSLFYTGATTVGDMLNLNGSLTGSSITVAGSGALNQGVNSVISNQIGIPFANGNSLTLSSSGTSVLAGQNTYTGSTTLNEGVLQVGANSTVTNLATTSAAITSGPTGVAVLDMAYGTLDLQNYNLAVGGLAGNSNGVGGYIGSSSTVGNGTLTIITATGASNTYNGFIVDTLNSGNQKVALVVTGAANGVQILGGLNTYSGGTTIDQGTLRAGSVSAFGTGAITVNNGGALDLNGYSQLNAGGLTLNGAGNATTTAALYNDVGSFSNYSGLVTLGSNVTIGGPGTGAPGGSAGAIDLTNTGVITGSGYTLTLGGKGGIINSVIGTGSGGSLVVNDTSAVNASPGLLTAAWLLTGANTFGGGVTINGGILGAMADSTIYTGGTFAVPTVVANDALGTGNTVTMATSSAGNGGNVGLALMANGTADNTTQFLEYNNPILVTGTGTAWIYNIPQFANPLSPEGNSSTALNLNKNIYLPSISLANGATLVDQPYSEGSNPDYGLATGTLLLNGNNTIDVNANSNFYTGTITATNGGALNIATAATGTFNFVGGASTGMYGGLVIGGNSVSNYGFVTYTDPSQLGNTIAGTGTQTITLGSPLDAAGYAKLRYTGTYSGTGLNIQQNPFNILLNGPTYYNSALTNVGPNGLTSNFTVTGMLDMANSVASGTFTQAPYGTSSSQQLNGVYYNGINYSGSITGGAITGGYQVLVLADQSSVASSSSQMVLSGNITDGNNGGKLVLSLGGSNGSVGGATFGDHAYDI